MHQGMWLSRWSILGIAGYLFNHDTNPPIWESVEIGGVLGILNCVKISAADDAPGICCTGCEGI